MTMRRGWRGQTTCMVMILWWCEPVALTVNQFSPPAGNRRVRPGERGIRSDRVWSGPSDADQAGHLFDVTADHHNHHHYCLSSIDRCWPGSSRPDPGSCSSRWRRVVSKSSLLGLWVFFVVKHYTSKRVTSESVAIEEIVWQQLGREQLALPGSMWLPAVVKLFVKCWKTRYSMDTGYCTFLGSPSLLRQWLYTSFGLGCNFSFHDDRRQLTLTYQITANTRPLVWMHQRSGLKMW